MSTTAYDPEYDGFRDLRLRHERKSHTHTFHSFSKLPAELRLQVWDFAMSERQIASLTEDGSSGINDDIKYGRLPAYLFVNIECCARALEKKRYPIRFTFRHRLSVLPDRSLSNYWVENSSETDSEETTSLESNPDEGVQYCAIGPADIVALRVEGSWHRI